MDGGTTVDVITESRRTRPNWVWIAYGLMVALYAAEAVFSRRRSAFVLLALWSVLLAVTWLRPVTRVDAAGVHLPVLRRSRRTIAWNDIAAVVRPTSYDTVVRLIRTDGQVVPVPGILASNAQAVAALGRKELRSPPAPPAPPSAAHRPNQTLTFERQVAALEADRSRLADELDRIRADAGVRSGQR